MRGPLRALVAPVAILLDNQTTGVMHGFPSVYFPVRVASLVAALLASAVWREASLARAADPGPLPDVPCQVFPSDNVWNRDISALTVHPLSDAYIASIGSDMPLHLDFGAGRYASLTIGIPYTVVPATQPLLAVKFTTNYADESDPGPYPVPINARIEGGRRSPSPESDRHVLVVQEETCKVFELWRAYPKRHPKRWKAGAGAIWDLTSNATRPAGLSSADAAGLSVLAGLVRFDEVSRGEIRHALRFTARRTQGSYVWPARHEASDITDPSVPPMGTRVRLKADYDLSGFSPTTRVILTALQRYGMILADIGSNWQVSGTSDPRWDNDLLHEVEVITGADFEVVDESGLIVDPDSAQSH